MKKKKLFTIHFAGGNGYSFQFLRPHIKDCEIFTIELPGRGRRVRENLLTDFNLAAEDLFGQINEKIDNSPFIIYGHSMGAYLALKVSNMLENVGKFPKYLVVSGNAGPGVNIAHNRYLLNKEDFLKEVMDLGGMPAEFFDNEELLSFFEPILRADFEISEKNDIDLEPPIKAPIYAIMGDQEEKAEQIENWGRFTKSKLHFELLKGGHFFIHDHPQRIAEIINQVMIE